MTNSLKQANLKPTHLWNHFYQFTQLPRPSKNEAKVQHYLRQLAKEEGLNFREDTAGNIVIYVPATQGYEKKGTIIIQNHMDMVTDCIPGHQIDFNKDPIEAYVQDGWVKAKGTTLGADNGIGCAAALALITDKTADHPALEILFTVDEESGLHGAWGVDASFFSGKKMINLDTEEWGSFYIGCAGGIDTELKGRASLKAVSAKKVTFELAIRGFCGGHSGIDIHRQRFNAIKKLGEVLQELLVLDFELVEFRGGRAHNIIPRDAFAKICIEQDQLSAANRLLKAIEERWQSFINKEDESYQMSISPCEKAKEVLTLEDRNRFVQFLGLFPHGAHRYMHEVEDVMVSMSNNLAVVLLVKGEWYVLTSMRFFDRNEVIPLEKEVQLIADTFKLEMVKLSEYPSWKPDLQNPLLDQAKQLFKQMYGKYPEVKAIHAGLECGILKQKMGQIDIISMGPTIMGAHSPDERVEVSTVQTFWDFLLSLLKTV